MSAQRLQQQKQVQQQSSDIARQLVGEVLDVQLQQFRDNNLTSHPWYGEIRSMRDHLDDMVKTKMKEVVDILEKADLNDNAQRLSAFQAARTKSREILIRIQVEQQILLRRLKIAALARQIQQLIEHQTKVHTETETLPGEPDDRRNELNLEALEDQRDVTASFGQFKKSLREIAHFAGDLGRQATDVAAMADKLRIDGMLVKAEMGLHLGDFTAASGRQKETIAALEALLQKIRHLQNSMESNSLEEKIAEALKQQEELHEASAKKPLEPDVADKLAAQQDALAKKIDELSASAKPQVQAVLEQAKHEAQEAANSLLEQKQPEALAHQEKAALDLKAAAHEEEKSQPANESQKAESAEDAKRQELENKIDKLAAAAEKLEKAAETERQIAKDANQAAEKQGLKSDEAAGLDKKNDEATEDAKSVENQVADSVPKAADEVKKALDEMKGESADLKKAEHSKTADSANADSAAKPDDAAKPDNAAKADSGAKPDNAAKPDDAAKPDSGAKPDNAAKPDEAKAAADQAKAEKPEKADAAKSDEANATAQDTGKHADEAAADLTKAAEDVRQEAQKVADELAKLSRDEGDKLASLQQKVDKELDKAMAPTTDRLNSLQQARKKVDEALQHQADADQAAEKAEAKDPASTEKADPEKANTEKPDAEKPKADPAGQPQGDPPAAENHAADAANEEKKPGGDPADPQAQVSETSREAAELAQAGARAPPKAWPRPRPIRMRLARMPHKSRHRKPQSIERPQSRNSKRQRTS